MTTRCNAPVPIDDLLGYWLEEVEPHVEARIDEHLLACSDCAAALQELVDVGAAVHRFVDSGALRAVYTDRFVERLGSAGLRLRQYRVPCNGSVHCSVAPDDDVLIARLQAPLDGVTQVDIVQIDPDGSARERLENVPFNAAAGEVLVAPRIAQIRALPASLRRMRLVAVEPSGERVIGEYAFHHTPWSERETNGTAR